MRLTTLTKYGLRALMRMTAAPDQTFTGGLEIGFSRNHSTRIMQRLAWRGSLDGAKYGRVHRERSLWTSLCARFAFPHWIHSHDGHAHERPRHRARCPSPLVELSCLRSSLQTSKAVQQITLSLPLSYGTAARLFRPRRPPRPSTKKMVLWTLSRSIQCQ